MDFVSTKFPTLFKQSSPASKDARGRLIINQRWFTQIATYNRYDIGNIMHRCIRAKQTRTNEDKMAQTSSQIVHVIFQVHRECSCY